MKSTASMRMVLRKSGSGGLPSTVSSENCPPAVVFAGSEALLDFEVSTLPLFFLDAGFVFELDRGGRLGWAGRSSRDRGTRRRKLPSSGAD